MTSLLYALIFLTTSISLLNPWIGVLAYYTLAILMPQSIWGWIFGSIRVSLYVALATLAGFLFSCLTGKLDFSILKNRQNYFLIILWVTLTLSNVFSTYPIDNSIKGGISDPHTVLSMFNKVILFYFVAIVTIIYYTYWANMQYFSGHMLGNRLAGPGEGGIYTDENTFAMLFVLGSPFLYFLGNHFDKKIIRYSFWMFVPWAWHAIFLTGSRGGLIGIGVVTLFIYFRAKSKIFGGIMVLALIYTVMTQGGSVIKRSKDTMERTEAREPINPRIISWTVGLKMMRDNPILGVGVAKFRHAFSNYHDSQPLVAHNTTIQFGAESGILAMLMYLFLIFNIFFNYLKERKYIDRSRIDPILIVSNDAITCSILGFFVCSIFLSLGTYESFYYVLALSIIRNKLVKSQYQEEHNR